MEQGYGGRRIQGIVFKNIPLPGSPFVHSTVQGHDAEHAVEDVTPENLRIHGILIAGAEEGKVRVNTHVKNVRFLVTARRDGHA
jgi:hypothetical protein